MYDSISLLSMRERYYIILLMENYGIQHGILTSCVILYGPADMLYSTLLERILRL